MKKSSQMDREIFAIDISPSLKLSVHAVCSERFVVFQIRDSMIVMTLKKIDSVPRDIWEKSKCLYFL